MEGGGTVERIKVGGRKGERGLVVHRGDRYVGRKGVGVKGEGKTEC